MNVHRDTTNIELPTKKDILQDVAYFVDEDGDYVNNWSVTNNYDGNNPLSLQKGKDFMIQQERVIAK